jgi:molybdopterin synthase sulfur carrier subunit
VTGGKVRVRIPTPLRSYTGNEANVVADGTTLAEVLDDLDRQFPGIAFRVVDEQSRLRQHMVIWLNDERCRDLGTSLDGVDEVVIMQALSGG